MRYAKQFNEAARAFETYQRADSDPNVTKAEVAKVLSLKSSFYLVSWLVVIGNSKAPKPAR